MAGADVATGPMDSGERSPRIIPIHDAPDQREQRATSMIGMAIFVASWAMMFGSLFFAYAILRVRADGWPPAGSPQPSAGPPLLNTLVIVLSSLALHRATRSLGRADLRRFFVWLVATLALGALFLALQWTVWADLWRQGLRPGSGSYGSLFYTLTVFHALHVVVGLGLLMSLTPAAFRADPGLTRGVRGRAVAVFWHFVGVIWIVTYVLVYVI